MTSSFTWDRIRMRILIHTSVKLVTQRVFAFAHEYVILIHTSVKLVTYFGLEEVAVSGILIHTSVKLVTSADNVGKFHSRHFNPHEREARDAM